MCGENETRLINSRSYNDILQLSTCELSKKTSLENPSDFYLRGLHFWVAKWNISPTVKETFHKPILEVASHAEAWTRDEPLRTTAWETILGAPGAVNTEGGAGYIFARTAPGSARTRNNRRLRSAGDNNRRSKCFCSSALLCVSFTWQMVKTRVIRWVVEGPNARDQSAFCAFHTFLMEVQTNAGYIHATHA